MSAPDAAPAQMPGKREMVGRKPLHIFQGGFSGRWYATASYDERPGGGFVARRKEDITDQIEAIIEQALAGSGGAGEGAEG